MLTSGFELTTAITNVIIFIVSVICYIKTERKNLWKFFFLLMSIDALLGSVVHGIVMSQELNNGLWVILALLFTITVNTFLCIFMKLKYKHIFILSILLFILMASQMIYNMDYLLTFTMYVILVIVISTCYVLQSDNKLMYLLGFIILVIGGILMLCKTSFYILNHNGIVHMFIAVTLMFLYLGYKKDIRI